MFAGLLAKVAGGVFNLLGGGIAKDILGGVSDHFKAKRALKQAEQNTKLQIELVKAKSVAKKEDADIDMNMIRVQQQEGSWKDEFWTVIFGAMFVSAFFFPDTLREGLAVLGSMDKEIKYLMGVVITTAFGVEVYKKVKK